MKRPLTPIERIFVRVFKRKMTLDERRLLLRSSGRMRVARRAAPKRT